nr:protein 2K [Cacipacore virus]
TQTDSHLAMFLVGVMSVLGLVAA